ncbi:MAG: F0F1 ATP synthase subunit delta [Puniceicoccales bacterium]|jgi:F-type H+-transporting ATPase subunit delta|nr:F0F1 ATP synthase subunit delta [Puniceicoccales bacterium]
MQKRTNDALIKNLVALSFDSDSKVSFQKTRAVVTVLSEFVDGKVALIKYFKLLRKAIQDNTLVIEYAGSLDEKEINSLKNIIEAIKNHKVDLVAKENSQLIAGVKISIGDEVYDASIKTRLNSLK